MLACTGSQLQHAGQEVILRRHAEDMRTEILPYCASLGRYTVLYYLWLYGLYRAWATQTEKSARIQRSRDAAGP